MKSDRTRVFIVEDHPLVREQLGILPSREPDLFVAGSAVEPKSALEAMTAAPPDVAIVVLTLKQGSGLELIKDLRGRRKRSVILSAAKNPLGLTWRF